MKLAAVVDVQAIVAELGLQFFGRRCGFATFVLEFVLRRLVDQLDALGLEIFIRDNIERLAKLLQPIEDVCVGVKLPNVRTDAAEVSDMLGLHIYNRAQTR